MCVLYSNFYGVREKSLETDRRSGQSQHKRHVCMSCRQIFKTEQVLNEHMQYCLAHKSQQVVYPDADDPEKSKLSFQWHHYEMTKSIITAWLHLKEPIGLGYDGWLASIVDCLKSTSGVLGLIDKSRCVAIIKRKRALSSGSRVSTEQKDSGQHDMTDFSKHLRRKPSL